MNFNERLAELRKNKGSSQKECAAELGVDPSKYNKWENGKNSPDYETVKMLAHYFDTTTDYLLGASDTFIKPEQVNAAPGAKKLLDAVVSAVIPVLSDMEKYGPEFSDIFSEFTTDMVLAAISKAIEETGKRCEDCFSRRDWFTVRNIGAHGEIIPSAVIDHDQVEWFLWPHEYRELTDEEMGRLYPRRQK